MSKQLESNVESTHGNSSHMLNRLTLKMKPESVGSSQFTHMYNMFESKVGVTCHSDVE